MEDARIDDDVLNLDELDKVNPKPKRFIVKGKEIIEKELPVVEFFRIAKDFQAYRSNNEDADPEKILADQLALLLRIFKPWNEWLDARFFEDQTQRKLIFLLQKAYEYQQSFAIDDDEVVPKEAPESPLAGASSTPI